MVIVSINYPKGGIEIICANILWTCYKLFSKVFFHTLTQVYNKPKLVVHKSISIHHSPQSPYYCHSYKLQPLHMLGECYSYNLLYKDNNN